MRFRTALLWLTALIALQACSRPDTVGLSYRFRPGSSVSYRLTARADASWDIGRRGQGSYEVSFRVDERVESVQERGAIVSITMTPTEVDEAGFPSPGSERRSFSLQVDGKGDSVSVLRGQGGSAQELDADQVAFIATYRPPLPRTRVRLHGGWRDVQELRSESVSQRVETLGRLEELGRDAQGNLATLGYSGRGPLVLTAALREGQSELRGMSTTAVDALLDIERGLLRKARSSTEGDFSVRVLPSRGAAPITGTLHLDLDLTLERI